MQTFDSDTGKPKLYACVEEFCGKSDKPNRGKTKRRAKRCAYSQPSKMELLAPEVKLEADNMLASGDYSCQQVANFIANTTGEYISQVAVNRYKRKFFDTDSDDGQLCLM